MARLSDHEELETQLTRLANFLRVMAIGFLGIAIIAAVVDRSVLGSGLGLYHLVLGCLAASGIALGYAGHRVARILLLGDTKSIPISLNQIDD
ncbi:MAG: hypothetical protein ACK5NN_12905 [Sphingomonadaceae bacterium]